MIDKTPPTASVAQEEEPEQSSAPVSDIPDKNENKFHQMWRKWLYVLGGLGVLALLIMAFRPAPITVDVAQVKQDDVEVTVDEEGETRIRKRYVVSAPVAGRLNRIKLNEGDRIKKGEVVASIDSLALQSQIQEAQGRLRQWQAEKRGVATQRPKQEALSQSEASIRAAVAQQQEAEARVATAQAELVQAERERDRNQELHQNGVISRQVKEQAELDAVSKARAVEAASRTVDSAREEVKAAQEALAILKAQQQDPDYLLDVYDAQIASVEAELSKLTDDAKRTSITAPADGYVFRVNQKSSKYVEAGTPLVELGNPQDLEIVVDLLSSDAVKVKPGATMYIKHWGGETTLKAQVKYIEPSAFTKVSALGVEEQRVNVVADFVGKDIPLGDRYRVETNTVVWSGEDVLVIPLSAIFRCDADSKTWCTFVVENDQAQQRQVKVSQRSNFEAVIDSGLSAQETVIQHPNEQIQSGTKVKSLR